MVVDLRNRTGAGIMDCKTALEQSKGNTEMALSNLRKIGLAKVSKKVRQEAREGLIESYIHPNNRIGVMIEVNCETDFVARNEKFKKFVRDICLHIAALSPLYISDKDIPIQEIKNEREIAAFQSESKAVRASERIIQGKVDKWMTQVCLLKQIYVKNPKQNVKDLLDEKITQLGENIVIQRFVRFQIGE